MGASPVVVRARGPLAVEAELVAALRAERDAIRADPGLLSAPLVVVVPSGALRVHVAGLAARSVGALAGVRFVTLARFAQDVLARAGQPTARGADAAAILVERAGRAAFPGADQRFGAAAAASVTDLLDAGLVPAALPALLEALADGTDRPPLSPGARRAAESVVRAAASARAAIDAAGVERPADVLARATRALRAHPGAAPCRSLVVHGFTDATGLQADFLEALVAEVPATLLWDAAAIAPRYGAALRARFAVDERDAGAPTPHPPEAFRARGAEAEAREVLRRARRLLGAGVAPERIVIVARSLAPYAAVLRTHADRLAIPISGDGVRGPATAAGRRVRARLELLGDARAAALDRWFAARAEHVADGLALVVGLRALGAGRLGDLAELDVAAALGDRQELRLPIRVPRTAVRERDDEPRDIDDAPDGDDPAADESAEAGPAPEETRTLARAAIEEAVRTARAFVERCAPPDEEAPAAVHGARVTDLLSRLGAGADDPLVRAARELARDLGAAFRCSAREYHDALVRRAEDAVDEPLGGPGGGVLVLDAATARGRAFEHAFVLGLNAGSFPALAREDPLLADEARARIAALLSDLAPKRARTEEEAAMFAQLLACAPRVTLSWLVADAEEDPRAPSPLLDAAGILHPEKAGEAPGPLEPAAGVAQPLHEHAVLAARDGAPAEAERVLASALAAARKAHRLDPVAAPRIAAARAAAVLELDRAVGPAEALGPYFGSVGRARLEARSKREIAVTTLENVARCPWQAFLGRVLGLAAPLDPLLGAPELDARATGSVAHAILAETAPTEGVRLETVEETRGTAAAWRSRDGLRARATAHAARILREEGRYAPGLDALVAARALELVEAARRLDAAEPTLFVLGAEVGARVPIAGERFLGFRADRAERAQDRLRLTDWKSGKVFGDAAKPATRAARHLTQIRNGTQLQAFVYALVAGEGRYVALHPDFTADERRVFTITADDEAAAAAYERAVETLLATWDAGAFFPRLVEHGGERENLECARCELSAACVRGDSGARLRFAALARRTGEPPAGTHEAMARRMMALRAPEPKSAADIAEPGDTAGATPKKAPRRKKASEDAP